MRVDQMFTHTFNAFVDNELSKISGSGYKIYSVLKRHVNFATGDSSPSIKRIAALTGLCDRTVITEMAQLVVDGYVAKRKTGRRNVYRIIERFVSLENAVGAVKVDYVPKMMKDVLDQVAKLADSSASGQTFNITVDVGGVTVNNTYSKAPDEEQRKTQAADAIEKARADIKLVK